MRHGRIIGLALLAAGVGGAGIAAETPHGLQTYEIVARVRVEGQEVLLRADAHCEWLTGFKGAWWSGAGFTVGMRLPSGRGLYMTLDSRFCEEENSPARKDWIALAQVPPVDLSGDPPRLFLSDSFAAPTVFEFPYRVPDAGYRINDADFELVEVTWHPLAAGDAASVETPEIDSRSDPKLAVAGAFGLMLVPAPADLFELRETPFARDPSGRYVLYRLSDWQGDLPLGGRVTIELLRRGRPLLPAGEGAVRLGESGRAVTPTFPRWARSLPFEDLDLIVDGWRVRGGAAENMALLDTHAGVVYLPRSLNAAIAIPRPEASQQ